MKEHLMTKIRHIIAIVVYPIQILTLNSLVIIRVTNVLFKPLFSITRYKPDSELLDDPNFIGTSKHDLLKSKQQQLEKMWSRYESMSWEDKIIKGFKLRLDIEVLAENVGDLKMEILRR